MGGCGFRTGDPPMNPAALAVWQAPFWAWCAAGAAAFALLCLLWSATSYWSARLLRTEPFAQRVLLRIVAGAALGAVIGGAGHQVQAQALDCGERGIEWNRCRVGLLDGETRPQASISAAPTSTLAAPPPMPHRR